MNIFIKLTNFLNDLFKAYSFPLDHVRIICRKRSFQSGKGTRVFAQIAEDYTYFHRLSILLDYFGEANISWLVVRGDRYEKKGFKTRMLRFLLSNSFTDLKFNLLFIASYGGKIIYRNYSSPQKSDEVSELALRLISQVTDVDSLLELRINGVEIGDLVYDTYLRFKPAPVVDPKDPYLKELLYYAAKTYYGIENVLSHHLFDLFISTYTSYVDHGIAVRLCLAKGIKVVCTGAFNQVFVSPTPGFPYHKRNFHFYQQWITDVNQAEIQSLGAQIMQKRFSGEVDSVTGYMKKSSFDPSSVEMIGSGQKKCIVMAHDFFDSPHVYGSMLFPDYFSWLEFILKCASECETHRYYVKPHPNAVRDSEFFYRELAQKYASITFLDPRTSNNSILKSSFTCVFTLNGTVAHEFPYGGIPAVTAGDNPHSRFKFSYQAKSIAELRELVLNPERVPSLISREEVELFAGVHSWRIHSENLSKTFPWLKDSGELIKILEDSDLREERLNIVDFEIHNLQKL